MIVFMFFQLYRYDFRHSALHHGSSCSLLFNLRKNNSKLYFVYLPNSVRYKLNYNDPNYQSVKKIIDAMNIPFIDIHKEVMEKEKNPLELFPPKMYGHYTGHYTVEGYRKISEKIYHSFFH